jgi:hypothetical protein
MRNGKNFIWKFAVMKSKFLSSFFTFIFLYSGICAQDYYKNDFMRYEDFVYSPLIKTVVLEKKDRPLSDPAIAFNSGEQLSLSFDELTTDAGDYSYSFILCNSNWQPASIPESQVIKGFSDDRIRDYSYSFNTRQRYVHYRLDFPNENLQPQLPGNYILKVFETGNPDKVIITRRWLYFEDHVQIVAQVKRATVVQERFSKQEIDFSLELPLLQVQNPFAELKVVIMQNFRWDKTIDNLKPLFIMNQKLDYNYDEENTFDGGNEFRTFDTRSFRFQNQYMAHFSQNDSSIHAWIKEDKSRAALRYSILDDLNGRFLNTIYEGRDAAVEAEYVHTHFQLQMNSPLSNATVYVFGGLTDWRILPEAKMVYDEEKQIYQCSLLLKQGYYNYCYAVLKDGESKINDTELEGNHSDTENSYTILVYHTPPGARFDRLAGYKKISSKGIF